MYTCAGAHPSEGLLPCTWAYVSKHVQTWTSKDLSTCVCERV